MAEFGDFLSGAAGGAGIGAMFGGVGAPIGAAIGGIASLFGKSADEIRRDRFMESLKMLNQMKGQALTRGFADIGAEVQRNIASARQAAARRAAAMGRSAAAETLIAPAESRALEAGGKALTDFQFGTEREFNRAAMGALMDYEGSPISPSTGDYFLEIGKGAIKYKQNQDYIKALREMGPMGTTIENVGKPVVESPNFG